MDILTYQYNSSSPLFCSAIGSCAGMGYYITTYCWVELWTYWVVVVVVVIDCYYICIPPCIGTIPGYICIYC